MGLEHRLCMPRNINSSCINTQDSHIIWNLNMIPPFHF